MNAPPLRVAVDARPLDLPHLATQGIGRYAHSLLGPLGAVAAERGGELVLLRQRVRGEPVYSGTPAAGAEERVVRRPPVPERLAELPEQLLLARDVLRSGAAVHHALSIYRAAPTGAVPSVVTVHDVIPLLFSDLYLRTGVVHKLLYRAVRRASELITVSAAAGTDISRALDVPEERITVIPEAADSHFRPTPDPGAIARAGIEPPFLLYVGGLAGTDPRKNVELLIDEFAEWSRASGRGEQLVLCGRLGPGGRPLVERAERSGARIRFTDFVPDADLPALYTGARCLITASRYEGFGLPALEAVACGTPVVAFRAGAIPEVAGPGAVLADDGDGPGLLRAAERICDDPELRARLAAAGVTHAAGFSWRAAAERTWEVYERAAGRG
jgi:glycosyltransferase involved in cell wall biosynthesis